MPPLGPKEAAIQAPCPTAFVCLTPNLYEHLIARNFMRLPIAFLVVGSLLTTLGGCRKSTSPAVPDGADWTTYGRTNDEQRFSPLTSINEQNISQLGLLWSRELGTTHGLEATPLVSNGVIYTTSQWSLAYAMDARTGEILWTFDPKVSRA